MELEMLQPGRPKDFNPMPEGRDSELGRKRREY